MAYKEKDEDKYTDGFNEDEIESSIEDDMSEEDIEEYQKFLSEKNIHIGLYDEDTFDEQEDPEDLLDPSNVYFAIEKDEEDIATVYMTVASYFNRTGHMSDWELTDKLDADALEGFYEESEGCFSCEDPDLTVKELTAILKGRGFIYKKSILNT